MFKNKKEHKSDIVEIDLTGPDGNAHYLLGCAKGWAKQLGMDWDPIHKDATSGDYEHLLKVLDREFGDFVTFIR